MTSTTPSLGRETGILSPIVPRPDRLEFRPGLWVPAGEGGWLRPASPRESLSPGLGLGPEGYRLELGPAGPRLEAETEAGLFYARQSLDQLLAHHGPEGALPLQLIEDRPRFAYRSFMLDVARHFFPLGEVKRLVDLAARLKFNVFHWHLTDDQGWRLPVPGRPALTAAGPAYTEAEIRELVAFAAARHVTVVPELDLPGHFSAALLAYPELGCRGRPPRVRPGGGIYLDLACAGRDGTLAFLDELLDALVDLFPGPYVHLGGDEAPKARWEACPACQARIAAEGLSGEEALQGWLCNRLIARLATRGKRVILWNESLYAGGLDPSAIITFWM